MGGGFTGSKGGEKEKEESSTHTHTSPPRGKEGKEGLLLLLLRITTFLLLLLSPVGHLSPPSLSASHFASSPPPFPHLISQGQLLLLLPLEKLFRERLDLKKWKRVKERDGGRGQEFARRNNGGPSRAAPPRIARRPGEFKMTSIPPPLEFCTTFAEGGRAGGGGGRPLSLVFKAGGGGRRRRKESLEVCPPLPLPFPSLLFCSWDFLDVFPCNEKGPRLTSPSSSPYSFSTLIHISLPAEGERLFLTSEGGGDVSETE